MKNLSQIWISIFFILKQFGVLTERMITREMSVYMLTTGKTIGESLVYLPILKKCALTGTLKTLLLPIRMDVN